MKKPTKQRPLTLAVETIRQLDVSQLAFVAGGQESRIVNSKPAVCSTTI